MIHTKKNSQKTQTAVTSGACMSVPSDLRTVFPASISAGIMLRPVFLAIEPAMPVIEMVLTATAVIPELIFGTFLSDRCYLH